MLPVFSSAPETLSYVSTANKEKYSVCSRASDIWMLGVAFWELLYIDGGRAFADHRKRFKREKRKIFPAVKSLYRKVMIDRGKPIPLKWRGDEPQEFRVLIEHCCSIDPNARPGMFLTPIA